jgi:hypothetical protein
MLIGALELLLRDLKDIIGLVLILEIELIL